MKNEDYEMKTNRWGEPLLNPKGYADTPEGCIQFLKDYSTLEMKGAIVEEGEAQYRWEVTLPNYYGIGMEATVLVWLDDQDFEVI